MLHKDIPQAQQGFLDLSNWNLHHNGILKLDGEWEFYANQLLTPDDFQSNNPVKLYTYQKVPQPWSYYTIDGQKLPHFGFATYRLRVRLHSQSDSIGFKILDMATAYTLWVNGKILAKNGETGTSKATMKPWYEPQAVSLVSDREYLDIILQVSNFFHDLGGFWKPILIGHASEIIHMRKNSVSKSLFFAGAFFFTILNTSLP